ncbi:MAG: hypothetical protein AAGD25_11475 [Cyanobacteria bacterium P01_F01_bin.150]
MPTATPDLATKLDNALVQAATILSTFFSQTDATVLLADVFGDQLNLETVQKIISTLGLEGLTALIPLELVAAEVLDGGTAVYVAEANTVYLAEEFLADALPDQLVAALLQQVGYVLDDFANLTDTAGSEGAIFEALVTSF